VVHTFTTDTKLRNKFKYIKINWPYISLNAIVSQSQGRPYVVVAEATVHPTHFFLLFFFYCRYNLLWVLTSSVIFFHFALSLRNFLHPLATWKKH